MTLHSGCLERLGLVLHRKRFLVLRFWIIDCLNAMLNGIPNKCLKHYAEWIPKYLLNIYNASMKQQKVPPDWLIAIIVPVHNSGRRFNIEQ